MLILLCSLPFSHENCLNQNYIYMYGEEIKDYILHGCQIETVFTEGILACYQRCLRHVKCNSINFDTGSQKPFGKCELNGRKSSESHQLIYRPGYIFVQTVNTKPVSHIFATIMIEKSAILIDDVRYKVNFKLNCCNGKPMEINIPV